MRGTSEFHVSTMSFGYAPAVLVSFFVNCLHNAAADSTVHTASNPWLFAMSFALPFLNFAFKSISECEA